MPRVSLNHIAAALNVSAMTVSRALRGQAGVSPALRERVRATAVKLGYRPDPTLHRLMTHLRSGKTRRASAVLCAVTDIPSRTEPAYCTRLRRQATARARELGFVLSVLRIGAEASSWDTLPRVLRARGVEGVLLLPMSRPLSIAAASLNDFSVVAATSSVTMPLFHRVTPDHAANARMLVAQLVAQGHRRIGFVGTTTHSQRTHDAFPSAIAWHHTQLGVRCAPMIHPPETVPRLATWLKTEKPDVVVIGRPADLVHYRTELARTRLAPVWVLAGVLPSGSDLSGLDEHHDLIGSAAVDALAGLVARGERGTPAVPTTISLPGEWIGR
jgi:DNA-binding LacI/PurR family transcriptional regulator